MDYNVTVKRDVPMWSETRWNGCWNAEAGVGIYLHMGRFRKDLDIWWAQTVAYLPDGQLAVDRTWGRCTDPDGVRVGNLDLTITGAGWRSTFDGVGELTTTADLTRAVRGAGAPSVPVRWTVEATGAAPEWSLYEGLSEKQDFAGDTHVQRGFRTTGTMTVHGREYSLDGVGWKDHSSGVRDFANWAHHRFTLAVLPDRTLHAATMYRGGDLPPITFGMLYRDGAGTPVTGFEMAALEDLEVPGALPATFTLADGETFTLTVDEVHSLPMTMTQENDNINGIDWDSPGAIGMIEGISRFTTADGVVGYGHLERSSLLDMLKRPHG
jgi:hypothetical protein